MGDSCSRATVSCPQDVRRVDPRLHGGMDDWSPMSTETVKKCDVCKLPMAEGSRRYRFSMFIAGINGETKTENMEGESDACSLLCVITAVNELGRRVS